MVNYSRRNLNPPWDFSEGYRDVYELVIDTFFNKCIFFKIVKPLNKGPDIVDGDRDDKI